MKRAKPKPPKDHGTWRARALAAERDLHFLISEIAEPAGWTDKTVLHAQAHVRNLIRNLQADAATAETLLRLQLERSQLEPSAPEVTSYTIERYRAPDQGVNETGRGCAVVVVQKRVARIACHDSPHYSANRDAALAALHGRREQ